MNPPTTLMNDPDPDTAEDTSMPAAAKPTVTPLRETLWVPLVGTLIWIGPLWILTAVGNAIALWAVARWGSLDQSLWMQAGAGWQRWPIAAAGFVVVSVFLPMFVTNGGTRRRLSESALVALGVLVTLGTILITAGFALERLVFDRQDWTHALSEQSARTVADVGILPIAVAYLFALTAWGLGGWILAIGVYRLGWFGLVPFLILGLIPVAVVEFLVLNTMEATQFDFLDSLGAPTWWIGIPVAAVVLALAAAGVARGTREIEVE